MSAPAVRTYSLRLGAFYGALFVIHGIHLPYLPVWLDLRGLTAEQIAIVTAAPFFLRALITPLAAMLADRTEQHRALIIATAWLALGLAVGLSRVEHFWPILLLAVPFAIALSTVMPLAETIAVAGVRAHGLDYGRMRLWGSITFVLAGFVGGWLIDRAGGDAVMVCLIAGAAATVVFAWLLPERATAPGATAPAAGDRRRLAAVAAADGLDTAAAPRLEDEGRPAAAGSGSVRIVLGLVREPVFLAFLLAAGAAQSAHGMFYAFGALAWQAQGISTAWIGALWAIAVAGEVALFAWSGRVVARWGPATLLVAATSGAAVRWALMSLSPPLALLVPLQVLHTLTYGASHLGAMHFISRAVPESAQGTAQALYATVAMGVLMGATTLASGWLYGRIGGHAYLAMAALAAVGLAAALFVRARWSGGLVVSDKT